MPQTIIQNLVFKNTTPKILYNLYMDAKKHTLVTATPAVISAKVGINFSAYGDYISGKNLHLIKDKLIVQTWRAQDWDKSDMDSIFIINFIQKGKDTLLEVVHTNIPDNQAESIDKGWHEYYWNPWKQYLAGK